MICCSNCFSDIGLRDAIEGLGHKGDCPVCGAKDVWIYDSSSNYEESELEEMISSVIEIYQPEEELGPEVPAEERKMLETHLAEDWNIFRVDLDGIRDIISSIIRNSMILDQRLLYQKCAIRELYDTQYMADNSIVGSFTWEEFKKYLRNENRFHNRYINLPILEEALRDTEITIPRGEKFYRARLAKDKNGYTEEKDLGAPPNDVATAGRVNSKGVSCLYLADKKETTVKEIRAGAFDYVTIGTFCLKHDIRVLDLSSITHSSPFYASTDKRKFLVNEKHLRNMAMDIAKPMSSHDSDLEYLPTQYVSAFAKFIGYDGVKYISTFDETSYNLALFDVHACRFINYNTYRIGNLEYQFHEIA